MRCLSIGLLLMLAAPAIAQESPTTAAKALDEAQIDRRVRRLSDELRSPFCPGKTIMTCTSSQAYTLRQEMRDMVLAGQTDEEVITALTLRYGDDIRNPPQPWYTVVVPFLPFIFGGLLVVWIFRRWRRGAETHEDEPAPTGADADRLAKLRARVAALDDE